MRLVFSALCLGILSACSPSIPDSGSGVGFDNSADAQRARELELSGGATGGQLLVPPTAISDETTGLNTQPGVLVQPLPAAAQPSGAQVASASSGSSADIAAETAAALAAAGGNSGVAPVVASPSNPSPQALSNPGISDENDFGAVSSRQSIESDAERIARNREQYQVVAPTEVPTRSSGSQPNIVSYALETDHPVGTRVYSRAGINLAGKAERNCGNYASPDMAQIAFLEKGGPQRDRLGLDPDGDGFACGWNPAPYRQAVKN